MLKYNIKLTDDSIKQEKLVWSEKYLAPDLSFVSGVTSQDYHLEKFNGLPLANTIVNDTNSSAMLETENVTRQGYVIISGKTYDVNSGSVTDYSVVESGETINYDYLFLNGKYYYSYNGSGFTIDNWLSATTEGVVEPVTIKVSGTSAATIDTIAWIEDGIVNIDGHDYFFERDVDVDSATTGGLKYYEDGDCLAFSSITDCKAIECHPFESVSDYINVTKFILTKKDEIKETFDRISFCKRFYYIRYKDYYLPIREVISGGVFTFKCDVPNYALGTNKTQEDNEYYKTIEYDVYAMNDESGVRDENPLSGEVASSLTETFDILFDNTTCVVIEDGEFVVEHDIMNANEGKLIAIYLDNDTINVAIGDKLKLVDSSATAHTQNVYTVDAFEFNESGDTNFVLFNRTKYKIEDNICDKVVINNNEYPIDYINGKVESADCLVEIGEEKVPMYISGITNGVYSGGTLMRYGKIISGASNSAITAVYSVRPYSGITVDNKKYVIVEEATSSRTESGITVDETRYYARLDRNNEYTFVVNEAIGSRVLICSPDINTTDFTDEFNDYVSRIICKDVVDKQSDMVLYVKNKIFGDKEITQDLAFQMSTQPTSSDDYFNLFNNLDVYSKNGYIHIPLSLTNAQGGDTIQDDVVKHQFFEDVKKRAINPIVDMEKDVYLPKYIDSEDGKYIGSDTDFKPIKEIRVNLHFRTRNPLSWKVNEGYDDLSTSGWTDNWFITDYHPYKDILNDTKRLINEETLEPYGANDAKALEKLMNTSDLAGLLYFSNDDVYYQKSKIAKSFLRFSFYDSTNPQTQSLLATSCVFMDEHRLFKRFIDNSRKGVNDYGYILDPNVNYEAQTDNAKGKVVNRITVDTEYLGSRRDNITEYLTLDNPYANGFSGTIISDDHRIGTEFIINNKYETDTSSEGYYLYIFREYSENLTPKPIYMKVEFNHAGIGRTIPFIIPMEWVEVNESKDGKRVPKRPYTLNSDDIKELKKGIKLEDVYAQTYIPLYAVYDFKNKEYAYVFDSRYVTQDENDVINLNLFELKIMNDEIPASTSEQIIREEQKDITYKRQPTAVIDMNTNQFEIEPNECSE